MLLHATNIVPYARKLVGNWRMRHTYLRAHLLGAKAFQLQSRETGAKEGCNYSAVTVS